MVQLGFSVSPIRLTANRTLHYSNAFLHSPLRSQVCRPAVKRLPGLGCQTRICSSAANAEAAPAESAQDGSPSQGQDWGSQDFAHTDWDYEDPGTRGIKKGAIIGIVGLLLLVWGGLECFKAVERSRIQPQSANEAHPAESKVLEFDDTSSRGAEFSAVHLIPVPEEEHGLNEQPAAKENDDLASNPGIQNRAEPAKQAQLTAAEGSDSEDVFSFSTSEETDTAEGIQESTRSIEEVPSTQMDMEDTQDTDSAASSPGLDIENESLEEGQTTDRLPDESPQQSTALAVKDSSTSQDRDFSSETNSRLEEGVVSDAVLEDLAKGMSLEALRQRALLAASAASKAARHAAACSASASEAAAMAASASERAIAASGNAQAAMEFKAKSEVIEAERRAVQAAQIASEAERKAVIAASSAASSKENADGQAQIAEDLSTLRLLRGSTLIEKIKEKAPIVWEGTVSMFRNAVSTIWQWVTSFWNTLCNSWPWLTNSVKNVSSKTNQILADISSGFQEFTGSVGDFCEKVMSDCAFASKAFGLWVTSVFEGMRSGILGFFNTVAVFFQDLVSKLKGGLNSSRGPFQSPK